MLTKGNLLSTVGFFFTLLFLCPAESQGQNVPEWLNVPPGKTGLIIEVSSQASRDHEFALTSGNVVISRSKWVGPSPHIVQYQIPAGIYKINLDATKEELFIEAKEETLNYIRLSIKSAGKISSYESFHYFNFIENHIDLLKELQTLKIYKGLDISIRPIRPPTNELKFYVRPIGPYPLGPEDWPPKPNDPEPESAG